MSEMQQDNCKCCWICDKYTGKITNNIHTFIFIYFLTSMKKMTPQHYLFASWLVAWLLSTHYLNKIRYVDCTPMSEVTPVTIWYIPPPIPIPISPPQWLALGHGHEWLPHIPFVPCQSAPTPTPQIRLFQSLTLKLQGQGHGCGQRARPHTVSPVSISFAFFLFRINQITIPEIQLFWNLTLKNQGSMSWVRSKVKVT